MAYSSDQKKELAADTALQAAGTGAAYAATGMAIGGGLGAAIGGVLGLAVGGVQGYMSGQADIEEEEAEKEAMDAQEDMAKIQRAAAPSDSRVLEASMPVQGGAASSSDYFAWRQRTQGY